MRVEKMKIMDFIRHTDITQKTNLEYIKDDGKTFNAFPNITAGKIQEMLEDKIIKNADVWWITAECDVLKILIGE